MEHRLLISRLLQVDLESRSDLCHAHDAGIEKTQSVRLADVWTKSI